VNFKNHIIQTNSKVIIALKQLNDLGSDAILFVTSVSGELIGSLTDGDIRRGLLKGLTIENSVNEFIQENPKYISKDNYSIDDIINFKLNEFRIIPVLDGQKNIINIINFRLQKSYLPIDTILMAGGRGERLKPLTDTIPKPMLKIGDKPIIEHNIDNLIKYGIDDFHISIRYLGEQIENYFGNGNNKGVHIDYVTENMPLGTIGSARNVKKFKNNFVLVTNSDLLTDLNYEDFFMDFIHKQADISVITIPYSVSIPYAVLELQEGQVKSLKEKPTYTYYSNGGIYLMKKEVVDLIPEDTFFNATDFLELLISLNKKVISYNLTGYWLDIGQHEDFKKAQEDIKKIGF
jgi:dTDP-glucose pyrophosphorylase